MSLKQMYLNQLESEKRQLENKMKKETFNIEISLKREYDDFPMLEDFFTLTDSPNWEDYNRGSVYKNPYYGRNTYKYVVLDSGFDWHELKQHYMSEGMNQVESQKKVIENRNSSLAFVENILNGSYWFEYWRVYIIINNTPLNYNFDSCGGVLCGTGYADSDKEMIESLLPPEVKLSDSQLESLYYGETVNL